MFQKGVYSYGYIDDLEKLNETPSPEKEDFYSQLDTEDSPDADYAPAKKVCKDFLIEKCRRFVCSKWHIIVSRCIWEL